MEGMVKMRNKATNSVKNSFTKSSSVPIGSLPFGNFKDNIVKSPDGRFFQKKRWHWYNVAPSWKEIPASVAMASKASLNAPVANNVAGPMANNVAGPMANNVAGPVANNVAGPMANNVAGPMATQAAGTRKNRSLKKKSRKNRNRNRK
jgi:hypothetical protein